MRCLLIVSEENQEKVKKTLEERDHEVVSVTGAFDAVDKLFHRSWRRVYLEVPCQMPYDEDKVFDAVEWLDHNRYTAFERTVFGVFGEEEAAVTSALGRLRAAGFQAVESRMQPQDGEKGLSDGYSRRLASVAAMTAVAASQGAMEAVSPAPMRKKGKGRAIRSRKARAFKRG